MITTLEPNSIGALAWGLKNFDGVEFDIRMSKDGVPVLHHDTFLESGEDVAKLTLEELKKHGIETLEEFFNNEHVVSEVNTKEKILWLELKPDCKGHDRKTDGQTVNRMYQAIDEVITEKTPIETKQINVFSFCQSIILPFVHDKKYRTYLIKPDIDECDSRSGLLRRIFSIPRFLSHSVIYHGVRAKKKGFDGLLFPHQYATGFRGLFHPSFKKIQKVLQKDGFDLVTLCSDLEEEAEYDGVIRFTDCLDNTPRSGTTYSNHIAIHRGVGTEALEVN